LRFIFIVSFGEKFSLSGRFLSAYSKFFLPVSFYNFSVIFPAGLHLISINKDNNGAMP